jgi:hypothetical protein
MSTLAGTAALLNPSQAHQVPLAIFSAFLKGFPTYLAIHSTVPTDLNPGADSYSAMMHSLPAKVSWM